MISRADACCTLLQQVMACADLESMMPADMQERILAETGTQHESGWRKNYFMPAQADRCVADTLLLLCKPLPFHFAEGSTRCAVSSGLNFGCIDSQKY